MGRATATATGRGSRMSSRLLKVSEDAARRRRIRAEKQLQSDLIFLPSNRLAPLVRAMAMAKRAKRNTKPTMKVQTTQPSPSPSPSPSRKTRSSAVLLPPSSVVAPLKDIRIDHHSEYANSPSEGLIFQLNATRLRQLVRQEMARVDLHTLLSTSPYAPLVVLLTHADSPSAMDTTSLISVLGLRLVRKRKWKIFKCHQNNVDEALSQGKAWARANAYTKAYFQNHVEDRDHANAASAMQEEKVQEKEQEQALMPTFQQFQFVDKGYALRSRSPSPSSPKTAQSSHSASGFNSVPDSPKRFTRSAGQVLQALGLEQLSM